MGENTFTPSLHYGLLTTSMLVSIKRLGKVAGIAYARAKYPQLTQEDLDDISKKFWQDDESAKPTYQDLSFHKYQRKFLAIAWLNGTADAQLARRYGVAHQTIAQRVQREIDSFHLGSRKNIRLTDPPMADDVLEELEDTFIKMIRTGTNWIDDQNILELARMFTGVIQLIKDELKGDEVVPTPSAFSQMPTPQAGAQGDALLEAMKRKMAGGL